MDTLQRYRFIFFIVTFTLFSLLQFIIPRRKSINQRWKYILSNFMIAAINNFVVILLILIPIRASYIVENSNIGIFSYIDINYNLKVMFSIILLDLVIYFQHRIFHEVNFLWKLHSVHHVDPMLDTSSGFRFHPFEIVLSNFIKVIVILIIGVPVLAVLIFEIILNTTAMFNHSNFRILKPLEKLLRLVLVTPDLHLIHHSVLVKETNSNYGFSVIWWDKIFKSYIDEPKVTYTDMKLGTGERVNEKDILFPRLLLYPFKKRI